MSLSDTKTPMEQRKTYPDVRGATVSVSELESTHCKVLEVLSQLKSKDINADMYNGHSSVLFACSGCMDAPHIHYSPT